ncbi:MAG: glycoside hydrolase family 3 C-terminal domain-containing protein [Ignavibacterium sp.]|jgi:beta-glucosidase|nr:glycoside hydrolase family 3 C-terminal domain-containing protein [Ignavibacterium sp.]
MLSILKKTYFITLIIMLLLLYSCKESVNNPADNNLSIPEKVNQLLAQMTLDEKIGQMTQAERSALQDISDIKKYFLGSLLSGGGSAPSNNAPQSWADMYDYFQNFALQTRLKIPLIYGIDAVHGHNNVYGATIFPHNIGLGCTRNPQLIEQAARVTAEEVSGTGIDWTFAPCIATVRDERWGRTYEGFGETQELSVMMADAMVRGFQGTNLSDYGNILSCAKHFLGDGGTQGGDDQGNTIGDEQSIRQLHLQGYISAINAGVKSIMVSYSSINGQKVHGSEYWITDVLKGELGFKGIVVSDWQGIDQLPGEYKSDIQNSINAGIDMVMVPFNFKEFIQYLKELVNENKISIDRIDDAVRRILTIKYELGLFEKPFTDRSLTSTIGSAGHREIARKCVRESLVLLKNQNNFLPLSKNINHILVAGKNGLDIGNQCGGWTISWQGSSGDITPGTTVYQGIKNSVPSSTTVSYSFNRSNTQGADAAVVVVGETPYAEGNGDRNDLALSSEDINTIYNIKNAGIPYVIVLISGRPMIISDVLNDCDAFVAAWLPGTEGQGIADVLFGDYNFTGKLSHSWPRTMDQIPINSGDANYDPLFPYGFGLAY